MKYKHLQMKNRRKFTISTLMLFIIGFNSLIAVFIFNFSNFEAKRTENPYTFDNMNSEIQLSTDIGQDDWWNSDFQYRYCINITNPYGETLIDYTINLKFNTQPLISAGKLQSDLDDIRIVENGVERNHYYVKGDDGYATVWFENTIAAGVSDYDTYMYYGNNGVGKSLYFKDDRLPDTWLRFEENMGSIAYDSIGSNDGTMNEMNDARISGIQEDYCVDFENGDVENYKVSMYSDPNYLGDVITIGVGDYPWIVDAGMANDELSSVKVPYGIKVILYEHANFAGRSSTLSDDLSNFNQFAVSSFKVLYDNEQTDYISLSSNPIPSNGYFSISLWFNAETNTGSIFDMAKDTEPFDEANVNDRYFQISLENGKLNWMYESINDGDCQTWYQMPDPVGEWHHVLAVGFHEMNGQPKLYVDGELKHTGASVTQSTMIDPDGIYLGYEVFPPYGGRGYFDGKLDDFRVYNGELGLSDLSWLYTNYNVETEFMAEQELAATLTLIVKDIDGRHVPNAKVALWDGSQVLNVVGIGDFIQNTTSTGIVEFSDIPFGSYDITVNYTLGSPSYKEEIAYDSRTISNGEIDLNNLFNKETIYADLWIIDFEISDVDGVSLNYGYIEVNKSGTVLEKLILDSNGKATFTWLASESSYDYMVYYDNSDYDVDFQNPHLLECGTITHQTINVNYNVYEENLRTPGIPVYKVMNGTYVKGSSPGIRGKLQIIETKLYFTDMGYEITNLDVHAVKSLGEPSELIDNLVSDATDVALIYYIKEEINEPVYGIIFDVEGINETSTECTGNINVILTYATVVSITVPMAKLNLTIIDDALSKPVEDVTVIITQNDTSNVITRLKTGEDGVARGEDNDELLFWYKTGWTYNISLMIGPVKFNLSDTADQTYFNYTLNSAANLNLKMDLSYDQKKLNFTSLIPDEETMIQVQHGEIFSLYVNFTFINAATTSWTPILTTEDGTITCSIKNHQDQVVFNEQMTPFGDGNHSIEINTAQFSAGYSSKTYHVRLTGYKQGYKPPNPVTFSFTILAKTAGLTMHDHNTLNELSKYISGNQLYHASVNYGEIIDISFRYYDLETNTILTPDIATFGWEGEIGSLIEDPIHSGYWLLRFDSSKAPRITEFEVEIKIGRENHQKIEGIPGTCMITVNDQKSLINGTSGINIDLSKKIYIGDEYVIFLNFTDKSGDPLTNLVNNIVSWNKVDDNNDVLISYSSPSAMVLTLDNLYRLDLNTEELSVGKYLIYSMLKQDLYEIKFIRYELIVENLPIECDQEDIKLTGAQGTDIGIKIKLTDPINGGIPLTGATVYIIIDGNNLTLEETGSGTGEYSLDLSTLGYNTFFLPETLTGEIYVIKEDYETTPIRVTLIIGMTEIFPGFPMFWFIMIISGIVAVSGSLLINRMIQQSKIPTFIKKTKAMRKAIRKNSKISDSLLYPSKIDSTIDKLGGKWEYMGLSIFKVFDSQEKKDDNMILKYSIQKKGGK